MAADARRDHTHGVGSARPAATSRPHRIVVETPRATAVDSLAERAGRLGTCTVERRNDGSATLALEYREPVAPTSRQTSPLSRILDTVERWLRQQPVATVTVWVDGRRFALGRRNARRGISVADQPLTRDRTAGVQDAARTASS
jgi:hypothetical protein